jgi:hypothetical protein
MPQKPRRKTWADDLVPGQTLRIGTNEEDMPDAYGRVGKVIRGVDGSGEVIGFTVNNNGFPHFGSMKNYGFSLASARIYEIKPVVKNMKKYIKRVR